MRRRWDGRPRARSASSTLIRTGSSGRSMCSLGRTKHPCMYEATELEHTCINQLNHPLRTNGASRHLPRRSSMTKRLGFFLALGLFGVTLLLAGLAWDALLHAADPTLAGREAVFTTSNPGHALLGAGVAAVV